MVKGAQRVIWLSGRPGAGKSTLGDTLASVLGGAVRLDGDELRRGLCSDLGFDPASRRENLRRAACVADLMQRSGQTVVCSFITPLESDVQLVREILGENFIHVYVATSREECERRDPKGHYRRARSGELKDFTGVSAPYEPPTYPNLHVETEGHSVDESITVIVRYLEQINS